MKRALRRYQKDVKYTKRLKKWACQMNSFLTIDKETGEKKWIYNPTWKDFKKEAEWCHKLKTMSTICSCSGCSNDKYNRSEQKKIDKMFLDLGFEE